MNKFKISEYNTPMARAICRLVLCAALMYDGSNRSEKIQKEKSIEIQTYDAAAVSLYNYSKSESNHMSDSELEKMLYEKRRLCEVRQDFESIGIRDSIKIFEDRTRTDKIIANAELIGSLSLFAYSYFAAPLYVSW